MTEHTTDRTAVYGPVRTVVWEGPGRKARPYPDQPFTAGNASDPKPLPQPVSTGFPWIHAMQI